MSGSIKELLTSVLVSGVIRYYTNRQSTDVSGWVWDEKLRKGALKFLIVSQSSGLCRDLFLGVVSAACFHDHL